MRPYLITFLSLACFATAPHAFDLQGHRGARGLAPENSLPGWKKAIEIGVDTIECDMAVTSDGVVVVHHDLRLNPDLTRGSDGRWLEQPGPFISVLSYDELQKFDIGRIKPGTKYAQEFAEQQAVEGTRIPKLADLFEVARTSGKPDLRFDCETKLSPLEPEATLPPETFAKRVVEEIRKHGMAERMTIQSFDWRTLQVVQKIAPEIRTMYLSSPRTLKAEADGSPSPWLAGFSPERHGSVPKAVKAAGGTIWAPNQTYLTPELLAEAKSLGLKVIPWTVNAPEMMRKLLKMGVDGIISDRPDLVRVEMGR